jgi:hypothetical protein
MVDGLTLRPDTIIDVFFAGDDIIGNESWRGVVTNTSPFGSGYDFGAFLSRPRMGQKFH